MSQAPTLKKLASFSLFLALAMVGSACKNASTATYERPPVRPVAEAIAEGDKLYEGRDDLMKVRQGIVTLRQAQADDGGNYDLAWRISKFNYHLGAHSPDATEQDKAFHEGIEAGKLAVKLQDGKPEGHFWLGANYGGMAQISTLSGFSQLNDIKEQMDAVLKINEGFQSGSAYMVLGQVYLKAPKIFGGNIEEAISNLEKGLKFGANNSLLRLRLAEAYAAAHRNADAQKQIDEIMTMKATPGFEPEHNEAVTEAKKLQEKIK
jgi:TRAP transporter T-component